MGGQGARQGATRVMLAVVGRLVGVVWNRRIKNSDK